MENMNIKYNLASVSNGQDKSVNVLRDTFQNVQILTSSEEAMLYIMSKERDTKTPILLLIDVDCFYPLLEKICQSMQYDTMPNVIPIACSENDQASFMLKCIQIGAFDFVLKPFQKPVIKTLFLNIYRHRETNSNVSSPKHQPKGTIWSKFQSRLEKLYLKQNQHWLSETIIKQYTPRPTIQGRLPMSTLTDDRKLFLDNFLNDWNFSPLDLSEMDLVYCVSSMLNQTFSRFPQLEQLESTNDAMYDFIFDVCNSYHNTNSYHNFRHAVDVMQSTWYFLKVIIDSGDVSSAVNSITELLRPIDILAIMMASLGHDVGHPGVNNGFMITTCTPLAVLYNDKSVLESYHSMAFFDLLRRHNSKTMTNVKSHPEYKEFRKVVVQSILCTDMSCHQEYVQSIQKQIERLRENTLDLSTEATREKERMILCSAIMKCADISNCARPFDNAKNWAMVLAEELFIQGDLEHELGIPSIAINQRGKVLLADFQLGFMKNVAIGLYQTMADLYPEMKFCVENINANIEKWTAIKQKSMISSSL